jgi:hypothetical protein
MCPIVAVATVGVEPWEQSRHRLRRREIKRLKHDAFIVTQGHGFHT